MRENPESICANCLKAKVYMEKVSTSAQSPERMYHYVKCLEGKWTRRVPVYSSILKGTRHCEQYVSMSDDPDDLNGYLENLPRDKVEYEDAYKI